jgi:hypothetical protein
VVATESAGRQLPVGFIERVKEDFTKKYSSGKARTAAANGLKREYGYFPKYLCKHLSTFQQVSTHICLILKCEYQITTIMEASYLIMSSAHDLKNNMSSVTVGYYNGCLLFPGLSLKTT